MTGLLSRTSLLHGLYDFSLSDEIGTITDVFSFIAVTLAVLDLVIIIALIIFIHKNKNNPKYTEPLGQKKNHIEQLLRFPGVF